MNADYDKFDPAELSDCISHFDLGKIQSIKEFHRGSRRAPKVIITTDSGKFLLKRRAHGKNDSTRVAFAHQIQLKLAHEGFPLPRLVPTSTDKHTILIIESNIYEMFEHIAGANYDGSLDSTLDAGRVLGDFHRLLAGFQSDHEPPTGSYHNAPLVQRAIRQTVSSLPVDARPPTDILNETVYSLEKTYQQCAEQINKVDISGWPMQIVHGDWHPGNVLFKDRKVVAVIDYDAARLQQKVTDIANGALQFSILGGSADPTKWPGFLDQTRLKRFIRGYESANAISGPERKAIPYLMCQAMIAEAVLPIAATGTFGRLQGFSFLEMVDRKIHWILKHLPQLNRVLGE